MNPAAKHPRSFGAHDAKSRNHRHYSFDYALPNVEGLDKPFSLDVILLYDPSSELTLVDVEIDGRRTMISSRHALPGADLSFFVSDGKVLFRKLRIRPLAAE